MSHCLKYLKHDRKARGQHSPSESLGDRKCRSLEKLPSYADLFGHVNTNYGNIHTLSQDETLEKQPHIRLEVSAVESEEDIALEFAKCMIILEEVSGRKQLNDRHLARLAAKCHGCQTTALVVGAYIAQTNISCGRYIRTIQEKSGVNLQSALSLTLDHVKKINPDAAQLFMFFAYFDYVDLAYDLIAAAHVTQSTWISRVTSSPHEYERTMNWLQSYGLVENSTVIYAINPLIHQWISQSLRSGPLFSTFSLALRCVASGQKIVSKRSHRGKSSRFTQHAQHLTTLPFDNMWRFAVRDPNCIESIILLVDNCLRQKQIDRAAALTEVVMDIPCLTASNMSNLAKCFAKQGRKSRAERLYDQALDFFRADHTSDSTAYLKTLRRLDRLSKTLSRTEECKKILKDVLNARLRMPQDLFHVSKAVRAYAELGICRHEQKRYDEAIALFRAALEGHEALLGPDDVDILFVYKRMGDTFSSQRDFDMAGSAYGRALLGYSRKFGKFSHPRRKMAIRLEKVGMMFIATEEGQKLVMGLGQGSPQLKKLYARWGCRDA